MSDTTPITGVPNFDQFEIVLSGNITGSTIGAGDQETLTIAHNLGFVPVPYVYYNSPSLYMPIPCALTFGFSSGSFTINIYARCYTDATNLYIETTNGSIGTSSPFTYKYFLIRSKASS